MSIIFISSIGIVSADSSVIYINGSSGNDDNDGLSWETSKLTIKNATGSVTDHGAVNIADGEYTGVNNTHIVIDKNIHITGQSRDGTIINGAHTTCLFIIINGVNVSITNLTLANGNGSTGGAIINEANLVVTNCDFINNTATNAGGAIYSNKDIPSVNLALRNCYFFNNSAREGGAICSLQSGSDIILNIINCDFTNNTALMDGGAIIAIGMNIMGSTFTNNSAFSGGAIQGVTTTIITDTKFTNNTAQIAGGAIFSMEDTLPLILTVNNCDFLNNSAQYGGAIQIVGTLIINGSRFTNNSANNDGGAILCTDTTIKNSTFTNNTAYNGGAIINIGSLTAIDSYFVNNTSTWSGGAISSKYDSIPIILTLTNCTFIKNNAHDGGAVQNIGTLLITNCNFTENSAINNGGAIYADNITIINSIFDLNSAINGNGGGIFSFSASSNLPVLLIINNSSFNNNSAYYNGGAISSENLTVKSSTFKDNNARCGGAISNSVTGEVHFNRLIGNTGTILGDDIYCPTGTFNGDNNWWGSNTGPNGTVYGLTINKWLVLNIKSDPSIIKSGQTSSITVDLIHDNGIFTDPTHPENYYHDPSNGHIPDGVPVNFTTNLGAVISPLVMINGIAGSTLNIGSIMNGIATITAVLDGKTVQIPVKVDKTSPIIISVDPVNNRIINDSSKTIKVTFNEAIKKGTGWFELKKSTGAAVNFTYNITGNVLNIKPSQSLANGKYILILHTCSLTDLSGNYNPYFTSSFTTDTIPPRVSSTDPAKNAYNVPLNKIIRINFNEPIKQGTGWIELVNSSGKRISITKTIRGNVLTITPSKLLSKSTNYTLILHSGCVTDLAGNKLAIYTTKFKTKA